MKELKFKTNINCTGCLSKVSPFLEQETAIEKWEIDLEHEDRILTVQTENLTAQQVKETVLKAGYSTEELT